MNQVLLLVRSPLLQGLALESSIEFFLAIVIYKQPGLDYKDIVSILTKPIREQTNFVNEFQKQQNNSTTTNSENGLVVHKQAFYSIAKIIAALTVENQQEGQAVITQFIKDIKVSLNSFI